MRKETHRKFNDTRFRSKPFEDCDEAVLYGYSTGIDESCSELGYRVSPTCEYLYIYRRGTVFTNISEITFLLYKFCNK